MTDESKPTIVDAKPNKPSKRARVKTEAKSDKVTKYGGIGYTVRMREKRYEPGMTAVSQNLPTSSVESRKWIRYFYQYEPYFGQLIDFFAEFPQTGTHNSHPDPAIKREYDELCDKIDLDTYLKDVFFEYFLISDVYPFVYINKRSGEIMETALLNPDDVTVRRVILSDKEQLYMRVPQELKDVVSSRKPRELYERLSADQRQCIAEGRDIPLNPMQADHLKRGNSRYAETGAPPGFRIFRALIQRDKLRDAQGVMADRFITPVRVFSLLPAGEGMRTATNNDVLAFTNMLEMADDDPSQIITTNFNVQNLMVGTSGQWGHIYQDIAALVDEFLIAFGVNRAILTGEGVTYANASVGLDRLIRQFMTAQRLVARMIERLIYKPFAILHGYVDKNGSPWPADLRWNELVDDKAKRQQLIKGLREMAVPLVSAKTTLDAFGLDAATEAAQIEKECGSVFDPDGKPSDEPVGEGAFDDESDVPEEGVAEGFDEESPEEGAETEGTPEEAPGIGEPVNLTQSRQSREAAQLIARLAATLGTEELNDSLERHGLGIVAI